MSGQTPTPTSSKPGPLRTFAWSIAGIITGLAVALVLLIAVELASAIVHPLPPDFGGTQEEMCAHVARYPTWVLALVVPAWALTAFAATRTAKRLSTPLVGSGLWTLDAGLVIGLLLIAGVLFNVSMLPYPIWFKIASVIGVIAAIATALCARR
jgi:hypothetical protein